MVNRRLQHFLESKDFYDRNQSGFRNSHSTLDGLIRYHHSAQTAINKSQFCVAVFLDISKAFDTVWHHGLLLTLQKLGLRGYLAKFIKEFLNNRKVTVKIGNNLSEKYPIKSGVPQGSVLSPTLFTVLINSLFENINSPVETSLFADDGALWIVSDELDEALSTIQDALDEIADWSHSWGLQMSPSKTYAMITTLRKTRTPSTLHIDNIPITMSPQQSSLESHLTKG